MHLLAGRPPALRESVDHARPELPTVQIGDQVGTVVAMETGAALGVHAEPDPGAPALRTGIAEWLGNAVPLVIAQARKLIGDNLTLQCPRCLRIGECQIAASGTVDTGYRTQRFDPIFGRLKDLDGFGVPVGPPLRGHPNPHPLPRQRVADEHHPTVVSAHATAAVRRRTGGQHQLGRRRCAHSTKPLRTSPGALCSSSCVTRSDEASCQGTEVTITLGMNSNLVFSRRAL